MKSISTAVTRFFGVLWFAFRRLRSAPELTIGMLVGLITVVTLSSSIPMYVEAANNRILADELGSLEIRNRPAFSFMYLYSRLPGRDVRWEQVAAADRYLASSAPATMGLPLTQSTLYVHSDLFSLFPQGTDLYAGDAGRRALTRLQTGFVRDIENHITLVEGAFPGPVGPGEPIPVIMTQAKANELGVQVGDEFVIYRREESTDLMQARRFEDEIRLVGIWVATDSQDLYWFLQPSSFDNLLIMQEATYLGRIVVTEQPYSLTYAGWHQIYDGGEVQASNVRRVISAIGRIRAQMSILLPDVNFPISPAWALERYQRSVALQSKVLLTFSIPIILLSLGYVIFVSTLSVTQQRLEIALLKSRGTSTPQVLQLYLAQSLVLGAISLAAGLALARLMAQLIGQTQGFLQFVRTEPLLVRATTTSIQLGVLGIVVGTISCLLPAFKWARLTIITFKQFLARSMEQPWWQRYFLDIILFGASLYGLYMLQQEGALSFLLGGQGDPLQNPLLLIAPTLFVISIGLLFIRVFPFVMNLLHWLSRLLPGTVPLISFGRLSRSATYYGVLLLLVITVGLSVYTASLAKTLDHNVTERALYAVGAEVSVDEAAWVTGSSASGGMFGNAEPTADGEAGSETTAVQLYLMPSSEAENVEGVRTASRVVSMGIRADTGDRGTVIGVERTTLPSVAFFRDDFAQRSLGALMNELAYDQRACIVNRAFLAAKGLNVGDSLSVRVNNAEGTRLELRVAGTVELFPTIYPSENETSTPLLILANIGYLEMQLGYPVTGKLWLDVDRTVDTAVLQEGLQEAGFRIHTITSALDQINREQSRLERVGLFGFLSIGFMIISFLSMLGLMLYAFLSLRQWTIQFGVLRAIGLTQTQLWLLVILEQTIIVALGLLAGAAVGIWMSNLFLPFLQVSYAETLPLPPLIVQIAWEGVWRVWGIVGVALGIVILGMVRPLQSIKMFEAIKLGEAQSL